MSEEQWDPTKDEERRQGPQRPGREPDRIRAEAPGGWKLDIMGPGVQGIQLAVLLVIAYGVFYVLGPAVLRFGDSLLQMSTMLAIQTCTSVEREPAKAKDRYEECKRGFGR